jgi:PAS domain S-box-containing protein
VVIIPSITNERITLSDSTESTVLVVDDKKDVADTHAMMLEERFAVQTAYSGREALAMVDESVDVAVLDRQMPDRSGEEVAREIRDRGLDCRIVLVTGVEPEIDIIELAIDDYLTKPASEADLRECVDGVLELAEYDDSMADFFALSNKREVLLEEGGAEGDELTQLGERIAQTAADGLQRNREVLETLIQSSPAAIVTLDADGHVDIWNPSAEELFGWTAEEVLGENPPIFPTDTREKLETIRNRLFTDAIVTDMGIECVEQTGAPLDISLSAAPLHGSTGSMDGMMFVMMDITERKQREQRISVLGRVLRHNLRNELTVVIGQAEVLKESIDDEHTARIERIIETSERLVDMSETAREIEETLGTGADGIEQRDIETVISKNVEKARNEYPSADVTVDVETAKTAVLASNGIDRAIWNLLENAIEHNCHDAPTVGVVVAEDAAGDRPTTTVTVTDDGPGIPADEIEVIQSGTQDKLTHGSGLGLWVINWVIERGGGDVAFDINSKGGTTVTVTLKRGTDDA